VDFFTTKKKSNTLLVKSGCKVEKSIDEISRAVDMKQIELIRGVDNKYKIRFI